MITPEERVEGCAVWENALVGFVLGLKPGFRELEAYAKTR